MKRFFFILLTVNILLISNSQKSNCQSLQTNDKFVDIGFGLISSYHIGQTAQLIPPVFIRFTYVLRDDIGPGIIAVGGQLSYDSYKSERQDVISNVTYTYGWKQSRTILGVTGSYHYFLGEKINLYGKLLVGVRLASGNSTGEYPPNIEFEPKSNGVAIAIGAGVKYYLSDNISLFTELGYDIGYIMAGLSLKID